MPLYTLSDVVYADHEYENFTPDDIETILAEYAARRTQARQRQFSRYLPSNKPQLRAIYQMDITYVVYFFAPCFG
jgi:hypothetical protein